jgi:hypothetical protein
MRSLFKGTPGDRLGAIDGLNLFFGALLGAHLGTLEQMRLVDFVKLIVLLAGTVMTLRMISTSERRLYVAGVAAVYALLLVGLVTVPRLKPEGLSEGDLHRLVATLAVWFIFVLGIEFTPTRRETDPPQPDPQA